MENKDEKEDDSFSEQDWDDYDYDDDEEDEKADYSNTTVKEEASTKSD